MIQRAAENAMGANLTAGAATAAGTGLHRPRSLMGSFSDSGSPGGEDEHFLALPSGPSAVAAKLQRARIATALSASSHVTTRWKDNADTANSRSRSSSTREV